MMGQKITISEAKDVEGQPRGSGMTINSGQNDREAEEVNGNGQSKGSYTIEALHGLVTMAHNQKVAAQEARQSSGGLLRADDRVKEEGVLQGDHQGHELSSGQSRPGSKDGTESACETEVDKNSTKKANLDADRYASPDPVIDGSLERVEPFQYAQSWLNKHKHLVRHLELVATTGTWKEGSPIDNRMNLEAILEANNNSNQSSDRLSGPPKKRPNLSQDSSPASTVTSSLSSWNSDVLKPFVLTPGGQFMLPSNGQVFSLSTGTNVVHSSPTMSALPSFNDLTGHRQPPAAERMSPGAAQVTSTTPPFGPERFMSHPLTSYSCYPQTIACPCGCGSIGPVADQKQSVMSFSDGSRTSITPVHGGRYQNVAAESGVKTVTQFLMEKQLKGKKRKQKIEEIISYPKTPNQEHESGFWTPAPSPQSPDANSQASGTSSTTRGGSQRRFHGRLQTPLRISVHCDECGSAYSNINNLQRHTGKKGHFTDYKNKKTKCPFTNCDRTFVDNAVFQRHYEKVHFDDYLPTSGPSSQGSPLNGYNNDHGSNTYSSLYQPMLSSQSTLDNNNQGTDHREPELLDVGHHEQVQEPVQEPKLEEEEPSGQEEATSPVAEDVPMPIEELSVPQVGVNGHQQEQQQLEEVVPFQWPSDEFLPQGHPTMEEVVVFTSAPEEGSKTLTNLDHMRWPINGQRGLFGARRKIKTPKKVTPKKAAPKTGKVDSETGGGDNFKAISFSGMFPVRDDAYQVPAAGIVTDTSGQSSDGIKNGTEN